MGRSAPRAGLPYEGSYYPRARSSGPVSWDTFITTSLTHAFP